MKTTPTWSANITPVLILLGMLLLPMASNAQTTFQKVFGDTNSTEVGKFRVTAVTGACSTTVPYISGTPVTGGYIAVGSSSWDAANNNPMDVYIVRTDNNGNKIWENTYDINGLNGIDVGASIIQMSDGSGFVVVGSTDLNRGVGFDDFDIFLMKIDCDGAILWSMVYGGTWEDQGFDLMEARTGSTVVVGGVTYICNPGDIFVVGWTRSVTAFNGQRIQEGYIMRTNPTGVPIWGRSYREGAFVPPPSTLQNSQQFLSLTDLSAYTLPGVFPPVKVEDLIAVGVFNDVSTPLAAQGWVVRVNANTGLTPNPALHGSATYGGIRQSQTSLGCTDDTTITSGSEVFTSVVELPQNPFNTAANVVIAGHTTTYIPSEIYLVGLTGGIPWTPYAQTHIGDGTGFYSGSGPQCGVYRDFAWTIRRVPPGIDESGALTGHLVVTGGTDANNALTSGDLDAFLLTVDPTILQPVPGDLRMQYGKTKTSADNEVGISVNPVTVANNLGFILTGYSQSNTECANPADPQDLYLVKTDINGNTSTSCEQPYVVDADTIKDWNPGGNALTIPTPIFRGDPLDNDVAGHDWGKDACTECWLGKRMVESPDLQESVLLSQKAIGTIRSFPNPIHRGQELIISHTAHTGESISVSVTNSLGKQVLLLQESDHSNQSIPIPTTDLPAGVYTIIMSNNNSTQHLRFIVVE